MEEEQLKEFAKQLRKPEGEFGLQVGIKMNEGNQYINRNTIEELKLQPQDAILEIGMGNGFFVREILSVDDSITYAGCDYSAAMVEEAEKLNEKYVKEGRASFFHASADKLPFESGMFNKIFTINTLYFWEDHKAVLDECKRVLNPEGVIYISVRPKSVMEQLPMVKYGFNTFSKEDIIDLLEENDFKILNVVEKEEEAQSFSNQNVKLATLIVSGKKK